MAATDDDVTLPDWLQAATRPVLHDLGLQLPLAREGDYLEVRLPGEPALEVWLGQFRGADLVVHLAGQLSDELTEIGRAVPPCPEHAHHPLSAELIDGDPWWVCASDERPVARIGQLRP